MNKKKIHNIFLEDDLSIDIPSSDLAWENMQGRLNKKEKQRPVIVWKWFYLFTFLFILFGAGWWLLQTNHSVSRKSTTKKILQKQIDNTPGKNEKNTLTERKLSQRVGDKQQTVDLPVDRLTKNDISVSKQHADLFRKEKVPTSSRQNNRLNPSRGKKSKPMQHSESVSKRPDYLEKDDISKNNIDTGYIQNSTVDIMKPDSVAKAKINATASEKEEAPDEKIMQAGLLWSFQLPINSSYRYFAGPNGTSQPYRVLLPGIWVSLQAERSLFTLQVNPFATSVLSNKPFAITNTTNGSDFIIESRTLHKVFGTTAGIDFDYNVKEKWWMGGHMQGNFWRTGVAFMKGEKINASTGVPSVIYENNYTLNDSAWAGFTKFQLGTGVQLMYKTPQWQAGIRFDFYLQPLIEKKGQKNATNTQVFIRWPLYSDRKK